MEAPSGGQSDYEGDSVSNNSEIEDSAAMKPRSIRDALSFGPYKAGQT